MFHAFGESMVDSKASSRQIRLPFPKTAMVWQNSAQDKCREVMRIHLGLKHIWARILSVYGPHDGEKTMVMSTINKLKNGEITEFTKGEQLWDYLYSDDAGEAFAKIGTHGVDGKIYVLGSGKARSLREYIEIIGKTLNAEHLLRIGALPCSDQQVMYLCADISELTHDTGWSPKTDFKTGIKNVAKFLL